MTDRERLKVLADRLPESELHAALRYLEFLGGAQEDPVARALREAPEDDEPLTAHDREALEESDRDVEAGRVVSHQEARRRLLG